MGEIDYLSFFLYYIIMEKLYEFKISSYHTLLYKDYCEITEEELLGNHNSDTPENPFLFGTKLLNRKEFEYDKTFLDEKTFVENYKNICAQLFFNRLILNLEKKDDKVSVKLFSYNKSRQVGKKYFKKNTNCHFLTYNIKQNCLYSGSVTNYHLKKKCRKLVTKNNWFAKQINSFIQTWITYTRGMKLNDFEKIEQTGKEINEIIRLFLVNIPGVDLSIKDFDDIIYKKYLDGIGVKTPNNWKSFNRSFPQVTKKIFEKNKYKFVDAYMSLNNLFGDKIKRVLHNVSSTEGLETLKFGLEFFGKDFILSKPDELLKEMIESRVVFYVNWQETANQERYNLIDFTKTEIKNCFEIFRLVIAGEININSFLDHISYKQRLKNIEPVSWKANNYEQFSDEHYIWSEKVGSLTSADYRRIYDNNFKEYIETPIDDYYPILLSDSREYNMESFNQSNCVRTYVDKPSSIIISLRKGSVNSKNRATLEYKIFDENNEIKFERVQSLGQFNKSLDETWKKVLIELDTKLFYSLQNNLFKLPEIEIRYAGKTYISHLIFVQDNYQPVLYNGTFSKLANRKKLIFDNNPFQKVYDPIFNLV